MRVSAILRETSNGTSYQMVRLVFRPYIHFWPSICTSERLRASTAVSCGFALNKYRSPSFGSRRICLYSNLLKNRRVGRCCGNKILGTSSSLSIRAWVLLTQTLAHSLDSLVRVSRRVIFPLPFDNKAQFLELVQDGWQVHKPREKALVFQSPPSRPAVTPPLAPFCGPAPRFPTLPQATAPASLITVPGWRTPPGPTSPTVGRASRKVKLLHPHTQYSWRRDPPLRYLMRKPFADPGGSLNRRRMHKRKISFLYFQFRALFTLFSKFFSSFLHSTCLLLVFDRIFSLTGDLPGI